jgi:hypothetical protein
MAGAGTSPDIVAVAMPKVVAAALPKLVPVVIAVREGSGGRRGRGGRVPAGSAISGVRSRELRGTRSG